MYFHMNKHHKKVMKSQKNVHSKGHTAKIFYDFNTYGSTSKGVFFNEDSI